MDISNDWLVKSETHWKLFVIALVMAVWLTGCPSPSTYTTPRTVARGKVAHSFMLEFMRTKFNGPYESGNEPVFPSPTYGVRVGLAEGIDVGARSGFVTDLRADAKFLLKKGKFDLAINPGAQFNYDRASEFQDAQIYSAGMLPVLMGINLNESFSLVGSLGIGFAHLTYAYIDPERVGIKDPRITGATGWVGGGFDIRMRSDLAVHPELTVQKALDGHQTTYYGGIGFNFGALPSF